MSKQQNFENVVYGFLISTAKKSGLTEAELISSLTGMTIRAVEEFSPDRVGTMFMMVGVLQKCMVSKPAHSRLQWGYGDLAVGDDVKVRDLRDGQIALEGKITKLEPGYAHIDDKVAVPIRCVEKKAQADG